MKLGFYTVPIGNGTPGRRVAVHYATAAPRQLQPVTMKTCLFDIISVFYVEKLQYTVVTIVPLGTFIS